MDQQSLFTPAEIKKKLAKGKKGEENVQLAVCEYLRTKYPGIIFMCDLASGMKMPIWIAARNKKMRSSRGLPDLFVAETRGKCAGLFIEIKKEGAKIFNTKGMYADQHVREQRKIIERLSQVGYKAMFGVGFQNCKEIIDAYMSQ